MRKHTFACRTPLGFLIALSVWQYVCVYVRAKISCLAFVFAGAQTCGDNERAPTFFMTVVHGSILALEGGGLWRYIAPVFGTARRRAYCSGTLFARGKDILYRSVAQATMNTFQQGEGNTFPQKKTRRKKARGIFCADFAAVVFVSGAGEWRRTAFHKTAYQQLTRQSPMFLRQPGGLPKPPAIQYSYTWLWECQKALLPNYAIKVFKPRTKRKEKKSLGCKEGKAIFPSYCRRPSGQEFLQPLGLLFAP